MTMLELIDHALTPEGTLDGGRIREIRLARPPVNALDGGLLRAVIDAVTAAAQESAILITGQPGMFSAGLDIPALLKLERAEAFQVFESLWHAQRAIALSPTPVIFGITGHCPAGGTVLAIHADYRVMAAGDFRLGLNEVQVGLIPGPPIHGAYSRLVGGHAVQLLSRGALVDPSTALRVGLVDEVCEASRCAARALDVAREYCALPREPMLRTRAMTRQDLVAMFGETAEVPRLAREFGEMGAEMFYAPATQERLKKMFVKKK
jgi:Delta3-Delta2-enoyl-CoA isomerase